MPNMRWFLLDTAHVDYARAIADCGNRHKRRWPNNILSVVLSDDGSRALVKSDSMSVTYRRGKWAERVRGGLMKDIFDRFDHHRALTLLRGRAWSNTRSET